MRLNDHINLITFTVIITILNIGTFIDGLASYKDVYQENLFIKPLVDGKVLAHFQFKILYRKDIDSLRWENKIEIFPLSLSDLVAVTDLNTLHFSLTRGNWDYRNWGYSTRSSPPGAQVRVKFSPHNEDPKRSWKRLVNSLAGKFCTSLDSADEKSVVTSKLSFVRLQNDLSTNSTDKVLYANLPEETFCTENLTPWKKLLPCYSSSGLSSLLNAVKLLKSSFSSISLDIEPFKCTTDGRSFDSDCGKVELTQSIIIVFNPLPMFEGKQVFSLAKTFGNPLKNKCPLASQTRIHVDITQLDDKTKIYPKTYSEHILELELENSYKERRSYATFDIDQLLNNVSDPKNFRLNMGLNHNQLFKRPLMSSRPNVPVQLKTHIAGFGSIDGTIIATVTNSRKEPVRIFYMDIVPYFLRVFLHTLVIRVESGQELKPDKLNYKLSEGDGPTLIEFSVVVPPDSVTQISYDFQKAFLHWYDYRPDANKGILLSSASIRIYPCSAIEFIAYPLNAVASRSSILNCKSFSESEEMLVVYAKPLLMILPTPDFSMPYNVLTFVGTIIAFAFGSLLTITTRQFNLKTSTLAAK